MKKLLFGLLFMSVFLAACQGTNDQVDGTEETEAGVQGEEDHHHDEETNNQDVSENVKIEGLGDHYHTGDEIKLTAVLDEETEYDHWHWYSRESADDEWVSVEGQESEVFTAEAEINGLEVKAVLLDDDRNPSVQSAPVIIVIDDHHGNDEASKQIYNVYFEDEQVENRPLSNWEGDWQSVYPYLVSGDLDVVFEHKAESGDMTAEEYKEYYTTGYITDVDRITIEDSVVTFYENGQESSGTYEADGYEILQYEKGNRGVRYIFKLTDGAENMPQFIQFSDHSIFPVESYHYHLYWGDDRAELLEEMDHWPTYYPSDLDTDGLVRDMLAH
ncbi:MAG: metal-binding protein ZinT [Niallia sp.]